jgi:hypothetical protein
VHQFGRQPFHANVCERFHQDVNEDDRSQSPSPARPCGTVEHGNQDREAEVGYEDQRYHLWGRHDGESLTLRAVRPLTQGLASGERVRPGIHAVP